jgi:hypothetical protein
MPSLRLLCCTLALSLFSATAQQLSLTADQIMTRVAANQDRSEAARAHYVYIQHAHVISRKGSTIRCEETTDTRVTPTPSGSSQQLLTLQGRLLVKGNYVTYDRLRDSKHANHNAKEDDSKASLKQIDEDENTDLDIVENMRSNLLGDKHDHSKDGINNNLFPLTSKQQPDYAFTLRGREPRNGRDTFHIEFHPRTRTTSVGRATPGSIRPPSNPSSSEPLCRGICRSASASCSAPTFPASVSPPSMLRSPTVYGSLSRSAANSKSTFSSSSHDRSSSPPKTATSRRPMSPPPSSTPSLRRLSNHSPDAESPCALAGARNQNCVRNYVVISTPRQNAT